MMKKENSSNSIQSRLKMNSLVHIMFKTETSDKCEKIEKVDKKVTLQQVRNNSISSSSSAKSEKFFKSYNYELNRFGIKKLKPFFGAVFADTFHKMVDPPTYFLNFCDEGMIFFYQTF